MFRKILSLFGRSRSQVCSENQDLAIKPNETSNSYSASGFGDVVDGLQFSPTFLIRTPCEILRANGMCIASEEEIPDYLKEQQHGIWLPKLKNEYSLDDNNDVGASDAYGASREDYITFVCGIKDIYSEHGSIFERVERIDTFKGKHPELLYIENKLLAYYNGYDSIIDILMFNVGFSFEDLANFHYRDEGYLKQILGVNTRVEKSLLSSGYKVAEDVIYLTKEQLMELDGVGNKSADKILEKIAEVRSAVSSNTSIT
ncbi:helix-hairpin-helix domain-containing protein [Vibrio ouci]|uniref:Helix-hairpin-helix domain-containing protein n=1 Tax=Vibrio ouci TaxID=2499078 RepID=A0A4Y8W972_9VIBR|nr:helix-hairpin-helix domain-containing protein [Vibrio ouci]TFH89377.1 helix-hairpin-helix domain-containing protein [Vibrio ouci]